MRSIHDSLCCKRLEWIGHLIRMDRSRSEQGMKLEKWR